MALVDQQGFGAGPCRTRCPARPGPGPGEARLEADGRARDRARRRVDRDPLRARLERVGDDAAVVVLLVRRVAGRRVEHVGDRAHALRQDRRVPRGADVRQDRVRDLEEVLLDADVRRRQGLPALGDVRAGAHMK